MDLRLGGDVDPLRRLIEQQNIHAPRQPFGQNDLLLIAAGQRRDFQLRPARADVEKLHQFSDQAPAAQTSAVLVEARQQNIVGDRLVAPALSMSRTRLGDGRGSASSSSTSPGVAGAMICCAAARPVIAATRSAELKAPRRTTAATRPLRKTVQRSARATISSSRCET